VQEVATACRDEVAARSILADLERRAELVKANEKADRRRQRRSMTEDELSKLLYIAVRRPLAEYGRKSVRGPKSQVKRRSSWMKEPLTLGNVDVGYRSGR
jgi:hypothetical protein